jgi:4-amino-4-deoxy-L-arabinose transferase-like glycosyltransferase
MPLAAALTIGLLDWFCWYESGKRVYLAGFYAFIALGSLAKGPIALVLATAVIVVFAVLTREVTTLWRSLWIPGILLFCAIALPWYIRVQARNPEFFRIFILEHNLARFATGLYHHEEPFWYYAPVALLALVPWTIWVADSILESVRLWWAEPSHLAHSPEALNLFLLIWLLFPIIFFSFSQSKLPGYILSAIPAGTILLAQYVRFHVTNQKRSPVFTVVLHSILAALPIIPAMTLPYLLMLHRLVWSPLTAAAVVMAALVAASMLATLLSNLGLRMLRFVTLVPVVLSVAAVLRIGGPVIDQRLTARPLGNEIARIEAGYLPAAVFHVPRETEYGLNFYRNQKILSYDRGEIPVQAHLLVTSEGQLSRLPNLVRNRRFALLGVFPPQRLEYYWVSAAGGQMHDSEHK